ncbi:MAG: S9 family peptidase [Bryobacterales bacterium]|nr:S9 family peptidase [Bryobacterales bacterium]MBV9396664.1 S9 family peptidase [Bryobacterales bacterium]
MRQPLLPLLFLATATFALAGDFSYRQPPKEIVDALAAPAAPTVSVSPQHDYAIFMQPVRYPPISEVAQPMLRLAGGRIDVNTNGPHLAPYFVSFMLKRLPGGEDIHLTLPSAPKLGAPIWSHDGKQFAFTNVTSHGIELWLGAPATGATRRVAEHVNTVRVGGEAIQWLGDNRTLMVTMVPAGRGTPPAEPAIPNGPHVQESLGNAGPAPTYEDLLSNPHDEDLFDYYATAQLVYIDSATERQTQLAKPGIYTAIHPSPDGQHLLIGRLHKPYSYSLPAQAFPQDIEIWDRTAKTEYKVASLPLADHVPLAGVRTGPRAYQWLPDKPATLVWVEALDGGNPREKVPHRDKIVSLGAPFTAQPRDVFQTEQRFRNLQILAGGKALVGDYERVQRIERTLAIDLENPTIPARVVFTRNERDAYRDPGKPVMRISSEGRRQAMQVGDEIFLTGEGASPAGDKPFLDRFNLTNGKAQRIFQSSGGYEEIVEVLDDAGAKLLTRRESPTEPPNYFIRSGASLTKLTDYSDPMPQAAGVKKQLVTYKRADGVPLSFTVYLPANYKAGTRLPALIWAYPYEFSDTDTAGQVTGHADQAFNQLNYHQLAVLHGYALIDNAAMPIVGDADTVNNTYGEQLLMDAQAAVDKAVEMGFADRDRIGVFGHSYGAFMTANLVAHSKLFRAAVAESGAYNRTLTPFGFQSERRTFWEVPDVYTKMSPFWFADKIKTPLLLIHGEADDNTGTFPIQSERMYAAVRGNGGTVRLVMLPAEAHGYRGMESMEHVLFEELEWFDRYLKQ